MRRFFWVDEDYAVTAKYRGYVNASHRWGLPGLLKCPTCGATWGGLGHHFPGVDLTQLPEHREFEKARPEPFPEFTRLRELVRPLVPPQAALPPGTSFGPLVGTSVGKLPDFVWLLDVLLLDQEMVEQLQIGGLQGLQAFPTALRFKQKNPPELVELQVGPHGILHADCIPPEEPPPCATCGRAGFSRPDEPILDAASLPPELDLFRLANFATMVIGTERFKDAVLRLGLDGLTFRELPTR
ncbi:SitI6 family double-CXXCG motif immunity protein [Myxococcus qinghaiensis]|uniref:SitI6 family double-CXXCG motif immunity protein n=1 Tax=Myxococcus qinghaiensis TaxID=2906758 RepID=UPI0020A8120B|nr:double-CXXCG motif protein [Myxococcus qinghaiensis]MCP3168774.1 double-CXXCG motif protein [Myxococcus qinghaiensis]